LSDSFVHLHVHTEYSMLDGAARLKDLFAETARMGMPALAMTDHGNVFGAYDFWKQAKEAGINPLVGAELYVTPGTHRSDRTRVRWAEGGEDDVSGGGAFTHMTVLAETTEGMHNLFRMSSRASLEGFYFKPRVDRELLSSYSSGLIATTGCPSGEIQTRLRMGDYASAKRVAGELQDIFGRDSFFCELMDHGLDIERRVHAGLKQLAQELAIPLVATNDLHYTFADDAEAHEVLLCVQSGKTLADPNRFRFDARDFYLKSPAEMRRLWHELPEACDNTLLIAERCRVEFSERNLLPQFPVPEGETEGSWLRKEVQRGLARRFPHGVPDDRAAQASYEVGVMEQMGFPGYFLVVADLCRHAREHGIRVGPGRGSAAGSMVAYALGITELDPIEHKLLFERFLNPERISMPDIDLDFDERRRGDMIRYATERYGEERVAQIITYGTIKAKQAIKDSARVLGHPFATGDRITKVMPAPVMGKDMPLSGIFDEQHPRYKEAAEFRQLYETDPDVKKVVDTARGLEGLKRQWGVHAAGVILSRDPLLDVIPIMRREQDGAVITQFDMGACESLGLLKMDFLGLRNLTVLDDCVKNIEANRAETVVIEQLSLDDRPTYELLGRGDTLGVFQLEGGPMRSLIRQMRPDNFEDISALVALYRPGPMGEGSHIKYVERKHGRQKIDPIHPELEEPLREVLDDTYGVIVYQEQVMAAAQKVAGYSMGQADLLRRAMGKKKKEILDKEKAPFAAGMRERGYSTGAIDKLWETLIPFADYAFNRSHSAGYGLVSYWTAYFKANYPAEYMAALLTSMKDDKDKSAQYLHECRRMGIKVLPPDVNSSDAEFTPVGTDIRFGLTAIRNVGENVVTSIIATRRSKGAYADFPDFLKKVEPVVCNKKVVESLVKAGAFDSLGHTRQGLLRVHADAVDNVMETKRAEAVGQFDLFSSADEKQSGGDEADSNTASPGFGLDFVVPISEWDKQTLLAYEREMLGLYVSDHPLFGIEHVLAAAVDCSVAALTGDEKADQSIITVGGILSSLVRKVTKKGDPWAVATLEDLEGAIEVMFFPSAYQLCGIHLAEDAVLLVRGRLDKREDVPRLMAMEVRVPDVTEQPRGPVTITLPVSRCTPPLVERLKEVVATHPGTTEVRLQVQAGEKLTVLRLGDSFRVTATSSLYADLKALLGPGALS
jgi:DNA polymerase-3 subunit alpha